MYMIDTILEDIIAVLEAVAKGECCHSITQEDCNADMVTRTYFNQKAKAEEILTKLGRRSTKDRRLGFINQNGFYRQCI